MRMVVLFPFKTERSSQTERSHLVDRKLGCKRNRGVPAKNLSLELRAVVKSWGSQGIDGNGQSELIQAITGLRKVKSGSITKGKDGQVTTSTSNHCEMKVGTSLKTGFWVLLISENMALQTYYKEPMVF